MPTENEVKYVLRLSPELQPEIENQSSGMLHIKQAYLKRRSKLTVRIRHQFDPANGSNQYLLHTKYKLPNTVNYSLYLAKGQVEVTGPGRLVEISQEIDERDFIDLWQKAKGKLSKCRYLLYSQTSDIYHTHDGRPWDEIWEVDFFKNKDKNYLCIAECELPEGVSSPMFSHPEIIKQNTVFRVPDGDSRFSNSRISDVQYATRLYKSLFSK